jgi:glycerate-2-kinase
MAPIFNQHRIHFATLCDAALQAVDASAAVKRAISAADFADAERVFVVGTGKVGVAMTQAMLNILGNRLTAGVIRSNIWMTTTPIHSFTP